MHGADAPPPPPPATARRSRRGPAAVLAVLAALLAAAGWWWVESQPGAIAVVGVLDGATIEVSQDGATQRVTLGGVVAPTGDECLAPEATAHLASLLPVGTEITLEAVVDDAATGAEVRAGDLVANAEMARAGYAAAAGSSGPAHDRVAAAQAHARTEQAGIYDPAVECSPVAQVTTFQETVNGAIANRPATTDAAWAQHIEEVLAEGQGLTTTLAGEPSAWPWVAFTGEDIAAMREAVSAASQAAAEALDAYLAEEEARQAEARRQAEEAARQEAARRAAEEAARRAEEQRLAADAERARQAEADRAAAAAQEGYRWSNPAAEAVAAQFGLTVRYVNTTACGTTGSVSESQYEVAGCYTTGFDHFEITTSALWEGADDEVVRFVAYHEAMHWLTWKTCGPVEFPRYENVTDAMTYLHGGLTTSSGGYGYDDADVAVAEGILAGTCPS